MNQANRLAASLLCLRLGVFLVMAVWTVDKFLRPEHAAGIFANFYGIDGLDASMTYVIGGLQALLLGFFVLGLARRWSYGLVLLIHGVSTFSSWKQYLAPFEGPNLLFFAAWPMLAACLALYLLRDSDTMSLGHSSAK